jgi:putative DNA methylase
MDRTRHPEEHCSDAACASCARLSADSSAPSEPDPLVAGIDWTRVGVDVRAQQRNREVHTPLISLFRWWARRPHALIGAVLDAAAETATTSLVVSDPFSGGGTVAIEAARRGLTTYAQDLHPWAITGLRSALDEVDPEALEEASKKVLRAVDAERRRLYGTVCPEHDDEASEILTALWVRQVPCPGCAAPTFLYPYSYISRASRTANERLGWWGCPGCGAVTRSSLDARERRCSGCKGRLGDAERALLTGRSATCQRRGCRLEFDAFAQPIAWRLALVQRRCGATVHLDRPTPDEIEQSSLGASAGPGALRETIPNGLETTVLRRAGLTTWSSLYTPRQIESLIKAAAAIDDLSHPEQIKNRLRLALCGAGEMAGRISRWDRHYPKAYEAVANHRFAVTGLSAEVNLLAERGRGVLKRRFTASVRAARWRADHLPSGTRLRRRTSTGGRLKPDGVLLAHGSSSRQLVADASVDLVLTDPPYFDDVQYAELAALFLVWARVTGLTTASIELDLGAEAVANTRRGIGVERYRELLTAILSETRRSLKRDGRMILTFHNTDLRAWWALGRALAASGFRIHALAVTWAENDADHSKRGRRSFTQDLVIECRMAGACAVPVVLAPDSEDDAQANELLSAGRAIASMSADEELEAFRARYRALRGPTTRPRISPTEKERSTSEAPGRRTPDDS